MACEEACRVGVCWQVLVVEMSTSDNVTFRRILFSLFGQFGRQCRAVRKEVLINWASV
jgi:hypothetical protein